jgi:hypothetical protein
VCVHGFVGVSMLGRYHRFHCFAENLRAAGVLILYPTTINTHVPLLTTNIYLWVLSQNCEPSSMQHFTQESVVDSDFCRMSTEESR